MKQVKIKQYRIPLSRVFPATHPKKGEETYFYEQLQNALAYQQGYPDGGFRMKFHTIRENIGYWEKRIKEIQEGKAVLVIYEWTGKPYNSPTKTLFSLDRHSGIGYQKVEMQVRGPVESLQCIIEGKEINSSLIAKNDGLSLNDFADWFLPELTGYKKGIVIHFTDFRY